MNIKETFNELKELLEKKGTIESAISCLYFDLDTTAPSGALENTAKVCSVLASMAFEMTTNPKVKELINECLSNKDKLSEIELAIVKEVEKEYNKLEKIPSKLYQENNELLTISQKVWEKAKINNDYNSFAPYLERIINNKKAMISYRIKENQQPYDVLLDDYEPGMNMEMLDNFFNKLREQIVPLLKEITNKNKKIDNSFLRLDYDINKQKEFSNWLANYIGFDFNKGVIAESEHPYTTSLHSEDVRITTHYYANQLDSAIFSTIHEAGHGKYDQGVPNEFNFTPLNNLSMGMHESQSRFWENCIGRSESFWTPIYSKLVELFPRQLKDISLEKFVLAINNVQPSLIRIEADELTYALHIMVRYEIEKRIFTNQVTINELPILWNELYQEYLGVTPKNDREGILQDVHWSGGMFGYFPTYALGSAIATQILAHLKTFLNTDELLKQGDFSSINNYLQKHIYNFGATKNTSEILKSMMNQDFEPQYYIDYLKAKYTKLYDL